MYVHGQDKDIVLLDAYDRHTEQIAAGANITVGLNINMHYSRYNRLPSSSRNTTPEACTAFDYTSPYNCIQ